MPVRFIISYVHMRMNIFNDPVQIRSIYDLLTSGGSMIEIMDRATQIFSSHEGRNGHSCGGC